MSVQLIGGGGGGSSTRKHLGWCIRRCLSCRVGDVAASARPARVSDKTLSYVGCSLNWELHVVSCSEHHRHMDEREGVM